MKTLLLLAIFLSLTVTAQTATAAGCNASCYAQKNAARARQLAAKRQQAQIAHKKAIAVQQARRKAAAQQRSQQARAKANARLRAKKLAQARQRVQNGKKTALRPRNPIRTKLKARPSRYPGIPTRKIANSRVKSNVRAMTPQQQLAALLVHQQRMNTYNTINRAYQNNMNNISYHMRLNSAVRSCGVSGSCRVVVRPK